MPLLLLPLRLPWLRPQGRIDPLPLRPIRPRSTPHPAAQPCQIRRRRPDPPRPRRRRRHWHARGAAPAAGQRYAADNHSRSGGALQRGGRDPGAGAATRATAAAFPGAGWGFGYSAHGTRCEPVDPDAGAGVPALRRRPGAPRGRATVGRPLLLPGQRPGGGVRPDHLAARIPPYQVGCGQQDRRRRPQERRGVPHRPPPKAIAVADLLCNCTQVFFQLAEAKNSLSLFRSM